MIAQMFNSPAELAVPKEMPTNEAKSENETQLI